LLVCDFAAQIIRLPNYVSKSGLEPPVGGPSFHMLTQRAR
jgi:hypothetical protein